MPISPSTRTVATLSPGFSACSQPATGLLPCVSTAPEPCTVRTPICWKTELKSLSESPVIPENTSGDSIGTSDSNRASPSATALPRTRAAAGRDWSPLVAYGMAEGVDASGRIVGHLLHVGEDHAGRAQRARDDAGFDDAIADRAGE